MNWQEWQKRIKPSQDTYWDKVNQRERSREQSGLSPQFTRRGTYRWETEPPVYRGQDMPTGNEYSGLGSKRSSIGGSFSGIELYPHGPTIGETAAGAYGGVEDLLKGAGGLVSDAGGLASDAFHAVGDLRPDDIKYRLEQAGDFLTEKGRNIYGSVRAGAYPAASALIDAMGRENPGEPFKLINPDSAGANGLRAQRAFINPVEDESEELKKNEQTARATQLEAQIQAVASPEESSVRDRINTVDMPMTTPSTVGGDMTEIAQGAEGQPSSGVMKSFLEDFDWYDVPLAPATMANNLVFGNQEYAEDGTSSGFPGVLGALGFGAGSQKSVENARMAAFSNQAMKLEDAKMRARGAMRREDPAYADYNKWVGEQMDSLPVSGQERPIEKASAAHQTAAALGAFMFRDSQDQQQNLDRNFVNLQAQLTDKKARTLESDERLKTIEYNIGRREDEQDDKVRDAQLGINQAQLGLSARRANRADSAEARAARGAERDELDWLYPPLPKGLSDPKYDLAYAQSQRRLKDLIPTRNGKGELQDQRQAIVDLIGQDPKTWGKPNAFDGLYGEGAVEYKEADYLDGLWSTWPLSANPADLDEITIDKDALNLMPDPESVRQAQQPTLEERIESDYKNGIIGEEEAERRHRIRINGISAQ